MRHFNHPIAIGIGSLSLGTLLRFLHLPFSYELNSLGLILILVFYPIRFFNKKSKLNPDIIKVVLISIWSVSYLLILNIIHLPILIELLYFAVLFIWGGLEIQGYFITKVTTNHKTAHRNHQIFKIAAGIFCLAILFKIMHWPSVDSFLLVGTLLGGSWAILEIYREK